MKKKKHFLLTLLVLILCVTFVFMAFACTQKEEEPEDDTSKDLLISNGDFKKTESENFPKVPTSWSGNVGSSGGSTETPDGKDYLVTGVIDVSAGSYKKNKKLWGNIENPGAKGEDSNVLMIYNKQDTVYSYTASGLTVKQGKFYKLSVWVKTIGVEKNGAYLTMTGDAYGEANAIVTNGDWTQYNFYVRGSDIKDGSVSIKLGLGQGNMDAFPAKGYAFFDNVTFLEASADDFANAPRNAFNSKYDCRLPDSEFDYSSGTYRPYSAIKYNGVRSKGSSTDDYADSDSTSVDKGIINLSEDAYSELAGVENLSPASGSYGSKILYMQNKKKTAYGYRASVPIRFGSNNYTKVSIMVRTDINTEGGVGDTVTLKLTTGEDTDDLNISIKNIDTGGAWKRFTFFVESNELRNRDLYLEMWLGSGGKNDSAKNTKGFAFFDSINYETTSKTIYDSESETSELKKFTLRSAQDDIILNQKPPATWESNKPEDSNVVTDGIIGNGVGDTTNWQIAGIENPKSPSTSLSSVYYMQNKSATANQVLYKGSDGLANAMVDNGIFKVNPNKYYRLSMWVKTTDVNISKGLTIALKKYDYASTSTDEKKKWVAAASVENINSKNFTTVTDEANNSYVEVVFYLEGSALTYKNEITASDEISKFKLEVSLGTGNKVQADKLVSGNAFIANLRYELVPASEYKSASTGTLIKTYSFYNSEEKSVSNGSFNGIDIAATNTNYDKTVADADKGKAFDENGLLENAFGVPKGWTFSNNDLLPNLYAGVFDTKAPTLQNFLGLANMDTFFAGLDGGDTPLSDFQKRNVLVIGTRPANSRYLTDKTSPETCGCTCEKCIKLGYCDGTTCIDVTPNCKCLHKNFSGSIKPMGYTSTSFSLTKDSYFVVSVWAKSDPGTKGSITLSTGNKNEDQTIIVDTAGVWELFTFYVETGLSESSIKLDFYLGDKKEENDLQSGKVYFDWATYTSITQKYFEELTKNPPTNSKLVEYLEDGFNNAEDSTSEALGTPKDWSFETIEEAPSDKESVMSGVFSPSTDDYSLLSNGKNEPLSVIDQIFATTKTNLNDKILVMNNKLATAQKLVSKNSKSLAVDSYYHLSVWVLTYQLDSAKSSTITLGLNNKTYTFGKAADYADTVAEKDRKKVNTSSYANGTESLGEWTQYHFYVKTAPKTAISDVKFSFTLGAKDKDNYQTGYFFIDNVKAQKIDKESFNLAVPVVLEDDTKDESKVKEDKYNKSDRYRIVFTEEDINAPEEPKEEDKKANEFLWLYITTGIIGGLLIIVIIVVLVKKFYKPKKRVSKETPTYDKNKIKTEEEKKRNDKKEFKD